MGSQEGICVPIFDICRFKQTDRQNSKNLNNDTFCTLPVSGAQCIFGTGKNPSNLFNFNDDDYSHGYGQIKKVFRVITKDDIY